MLIDEERGCGAHVAPQTILVMEQHALSVFVKDCGVQLVDREPVGGEYFFVKLRSKLVLMFEERIVHLPECAEIGRQFSDCRCLDGFGVHVDTRKISKNESEVTSEMTHQSPDDQSSRIAVLALIVAVLQQRHGRIDVSQDMV
jgi:hypothetical protein